MPAVAIALLARYWRPIALAGLLAAALLYRAVLIRQRDNARAALNAAQGRIAALADANAKCAADVRAQNDAVAAIKRAAEQATTEARMREAAAIQDAIDARNLAAVRIRNISRAAIGPRCEDAIRYLRDNALELGKW